MKPLSPSHIRAISRHPWGNDELHSMAHAKWLGNKLIKQINEKLQKGYIVEQIKLFQPVEIDLPNDLAEFPECVTYIKNQLEQNGWKVRFKYNSELSTCRTTVILEEKI